MKDFLCVYIGEKIVNKFYILLPLFSLISSPKYARNWKWTEGFLNAGDSDHVMYELLEISLMYKYLEDETLRE